MEEKWTDEFSVQNPARVAAKERREWRHQCKQDQRWLNAYIGREDNGGITKKAIKQLRKFFRYVHYLSAFKLAFARR